ncbi:hypothetical protein P280DRAFT_554846 [Massarina eburnea CBS 473.64]|uniref:2EXR domain-containing protein n=1 Tax=Massarina eburnea CBS 473.64 TaxID=1395130 RepID=A0A6A6RGG1_9PLEO|nr:hypothetical protein P280DRAFT_554846 [Massarina eburnea CBS 473.64]
MIFVVVPIEFFATYSSSFRRHKDHRNDMVKTTPVPTTAPFRFLDLPGELRNNIYELCAPPTSSIEIHLCSASSTLNDHWYNSHRALTLVNRHIRKEFLPIYYSGRELSVPFQYLGEAAATYMNPRSGPKVTTSRARFAYPVRKHCADIKPFLTACVEKDFQLNSSVWNDPRPMERTKELVKFDQFVQRYQEKINPTWRRYMQESVVAVELDMHRVAISIWIKFDLTLQRANCYYLTHVPKRSGKAIRLWIKETECALPEGWHITLKSQEGK